MVKCLMKKFISILFLLTTLSAVADPCPSDLPAEFKNMYPQPHRCLVLADVHNDVWYRLVQADYGERKTFHSEEKTGRKFYFVRDLFWTERPNLEKLLYKSEELRFFHNRENLETYHRGSEQFQKLTLNSIRLIEKKICIDWAAPSPYTGVIRHCEGEEPEALYKISPGELRIPEVTELARQHLSTVLKNTVNLFSSRLGGGRSSNAIWYFPAENGNPSHWQIKYYDENVSGVAPYYIVSVYNKDKVSSVKNLTPIPTPPWLKIIPKLYVRTSPDIPYCNTDEVSLVYPISKAEMESGASAKVDGECHFKGKIESLKHPKYDGITRRLTECREGNVHSGDLHFIDQGKVVKIQTCACSIEVKCEGKKVTAVGFSW